jgi:hypothetical protein
MISIDRTLVSDDVKDHFFVCNLSKCKGACCVEGDLGAPVEEEERAILEKIYPQVKPYLSKKGQEVIEKEGTWVMDWEGDYSTPTIDNKECAYAAYDEKGILKCGIEQAQRDGKIDFLKPISCHLYPIRISKYDEFEALNYDRWDICSDACDFGRELKVPIYKFLKEPLIRKYGEEWYARLVKQIEQPEGEEQGN